MGAPGWNIAIGSGGPLADRRARSGKYRFADSNSSSIWALPICFTSNPLSLNSHWDRGRPAPQWEFKESGFDVNQIGRAQIELLLESAYRYLPLRARRSANGPPEPIAMFRPGAPIAMLSPASAAHAQATSD